MTEQLERIVLNKGRITQSFDAAAAAYLLSKGDWRKVANARSNVRQKPEQQPATPSTSQDEAI